MGSLIPVSLRMGEHTEDFISSIAVLLFRGVSAPKGNLTKDLREKLERLPGLIRKKVVEKTDAGSTALAIACVSGNVTIVDYLVKVCDANIEQRSTGPHRLNASTSSYTPLYWACKNGKFEVVKCLVELGAMVNGLSDCGSTPVLIACTQKDDRIIRYLIKKGADIRKPNHSDETCFTVYVTSMVIDIAMFMNRDLETIQLLLEHGADPFTKTRNGDDALQFACRNANSKIASYLMTLIDYTTERMADANELLGATLFIFFNYDSSLVHWLRAHHIRMNGDSYIQKRPAISPRPAYANTREFTTIAELEAIVVDIDAIRIQTLLICERLLGIDDEDTLLYMTCFGYYYKITNPQMSLDVWLLVLQRRVQKHTIFHPDSLSDAENLLNFIPDLLERKGSFLPRFEDVFSVFQLLASNVIEARQLSSTYSFHQKQQSYDNCILNWLPRLISALLSIAASEQKCELVENSVRELVRKNIRCALTGETLLHMSVKHCEDSDVGEKQDFRNFATVKLLLECGAHLDLPDLNGVRPWDLLIENPLNDIPFHNYISLECHCASVIVKCGISYRNKLPPTLEDFVRAHEWQRAAA